MSLRGELASSSNLFPTRILPRAAASVDADKRLAEQARKGRIVTNSFRIEWRWLVSLLVLVVFFIPPRRYAVPAGLPFELDPYRLVVAGLVFAWFLSALSDERMRPRKSGLAAPLFVFGLAIVGSLAANPGRVSAYQTDVIKQLSVVVGYFVVFYLLVNLLRTRSACETALSVLVISGAMLAVFAIVERQFGWSPFVHLDRFIPFIQPSTDHAMGVAELANDYRGVRAFGSAEHPIALGALLAMLAPIAAALGVVRRQPIWAVCLLLLVMGSFATLSRTAVLMLFGWALLFTILRWQDAKRFIPYALVALAMIHMAMPGALGALRSALHPGSVVKEQSTKPDSQLAAGRFADLGPSFEEFRQKPVLGYGLGTRITVGERANSRLLDDQWLGTLLDTGLIGLVGFVWLLWRYIGRMSSASRRTGADGVVLAALASAVFAYGLGMFTFDALAFTQVTLILFVILAIGSALVLAAEPVIEVPEQAATSQPRPQVSLRPVDDVS
jgi:O-antigen ligase